MNHVLLIDDNRTLLEGMAEALLQDDISVSLCETAREAFDTYAKKKFPVVVTDLKLPDTSGIDVLKELRRSDPEILVILITAYGTVDVAVEAMKAGAFDFVTKPFPADEIVVKVKKALEQYALRRKVDRLTRETAVLRQEIRGRFDPDAIIGDSPLLLEIKKNIEQLATSKVSVLVLGETGTGKELVARAIHYKSDRKSGPFIPVNCPVFSESLLESELFGHEKGAFTGAEARKPGRFELANRGTIFLDEVGELPVGAQAKLLRVLQEQEFERVGGTEAVNVDVRLIAATNRDLAREVREGRFREDLYYRLNVVPIELPPLRARKGDVPRLLDHFLQRYARENHKQVDGFTEDAMKLVMEYEWPGNVRELENMVERGVVLTRTPRIDASLLPFGTSQPDRRQDDARSLPDRVERFEKTIIENTLRACEGNATKAADKLHISRSTLRYKIEKYKIEKYPL